MNYLLSSLVNLFEDLLTLLEISYGFFRYFFLRRQTLLAEISLYSLPDLRGVPVFLLNSINLC